MPGTQEITRRIKSVKSTRKITRALQMVSAAKMRKAQNSTLASRSYSQLAAELIKDLGNAGELTNPLLKTHPDAQKVGIVIVSTNKGMVGGLNSNLFLELKTIEGQSPELIYEFVVVGKKARDAAGRLRKEIIAEFPKLDSKIPIENIYPIAKLLSEKYKAGEYKKIILVYNYFVSTLSQKPKAVQLLPFIAETANAKDVNQKTEYLFEPSPRIVLNHLIPRIVESQIYQAILESDASEHSARMVMMKNATDAAGDLIDDLTLTYNQLRQNKITTELSEITAGRISLEK